MEFAPHWLVRAASIFALVVSAPAQKPATEENDAKVQPSAPGNGEVDIERVREELGVNEFTAPSIEQVLAELMDLRPIDIDKVWVDLPVGTPQTRPRLALASGQVIADGILAVIAEKPSRVEPCARALLRFAKGLGVSDHVTKHSKSIIERAAKKDWRKVRLELVKAQADVEAGMMALKDEEIAHLVSLGGWLRGLEIVSTLILEDYTPARGQRLVQPEALDYFIDRLGTLNPNLKSQKLFEQITVTLKEVRAATVKADGSAPTADDIKKARDAAKAMNQEIADTSA
ncbi:MAG: hypothetical protein ABI680_13505 [Chthoniobacteraceae bacterium]